MSESTNFTNTGLYSGNVIVEYNTDQKVVKPVIKVNEKTSPEEIDKAVAFAIHALKKSTLALVMEDITIPEPLNGVGGSPVNTDEILSRKDVKDLEGHL